MDDFKTKRKYIIFGSFGFKSNPLNIKKNLLNSTNYVFNPLQHHGFWGMFDTWMEKTRFHSPG